MRYNKLILLLLIYVNNSFFIHESFPQIRRISENSKQKGGKIYIIDIDGTICDTKKSNYNESTPKLNNIKKFNKLYDMGNEIHYWTARGALSGKNWDKYTIEQLNKWGVKYTSINMGKPHYDVWIDDKAINIIDFL